MDYLWTFYPWAKALHVMSVLAWMAGLFYLPRLFVHHVEQTGTDGRMHDVFVMMERKLLKLIMNPAMIAAWVFGMVMGATPGAIDFSGDIWFHIKLAAVVVMTWFHMWLAARRKELEAGTNTRTGRSYRIMNEVPTLLMIVIVIMVIVKPF